MDSISSREYHEGLWDVLKEQDERVHTLIVREYDRLQDSLQLIAAENLCTRAVLAALGSIVQNKTTEGFPRARFHGGCEVVDDIEELAVARARETFGAHYANVQPHSGTAANQIVMTALLEKGDRVLCLGLNQGGHVSHGAKVSFGGKFFDVEDYYVDRQTYRLDEESIRQKAMALKPKLIICGASAYSRIIDFQQFRRIADDVGAYLMADISHIAGLIIAGAHPSPIDEVHFSTTSTYKPGGPRGGLILMGKDYDRQIEVSGKKMALWKLIQKTTFPGVQGTPYLNNIAAKAVFFKETLSPEYRSRQFKIIENARQLARNLCDRGYDVLTGGTDNHMILINMANLREGMTGAIAQECLEDCGIIINKNRLPYDTRSAAVTSGARLGTPIVTRNGMGPEQMDTIAGFIDTALREVTIISEREYEIEDSLKDDIRQRVAELCHEFPMS
jgi:glycine hydroxymethyltransferase